MKRHVCLMLMALCSFPLFAKTSTNTQQEVQRLQQQTRDLQSQLDALKEQLAASTAHSKPGKLEVIPLVPAITKAQPSPEGSAPPKKTTDNKQFSPIVKREQKNYFSQITPIFHSTTVTVHSPDFDADPESMEFYPTALVADNHVLTYIAGTPVISSPYLGSRPAFDGSDYIVNISSINRDIRLLQQRRNLYRAYHKIGYPGPNMPIIALSGKAEPIATVGQPYIGETRSDLTLGTSELDIAAILNSAVEAYIGIAYDASPPNDNGQRISNSSFDLNMGFINIGNLDRTPWYFTAGQLFVPFGRFSTSMISASLPLRLGRTKSRPFILGYKSQKDTGLFAALYGFRSDTTLGSTGIGGANLGYILDTWDASTEIGVSFISSLDDAGGLQATGAGPNTNTFGGFASRTNGNEFVKKIPGFGTHLNISYDRYNLIAEWVSALQRYRVQDLSYNGEGAIPQAGQVEFGVTFMAFDRPSSVALGYQWTGDALALVLPRQRIDAVFNISIWKDTVESIEYRHDMDYGTSDYGNGAAPIGLTNTNTIGTGGEANAVFVQIGVYF